MNLRLVFATIATLSIATSSYAAETCAQRFADARIDPGSLVPGDTHHLGPDEFIVAKNDSPERICGRIDAAKSADADIRGQLVTATKQRDAAQDEVMQYKAADNVIKRNYLWFVAAAWVGSVSTAVFFILWVTKRR